MSKMNNSVEMKDARDKIREKFGTGANRTGGKGSIRRKKPTVHKTQAVDDKKFQGTIRKLGFTQIPAVEEVTMTTDHGTVLSFTNPKVQASPPANTYVVIGHAEEKPAQPLPPGQLPQDLLSSLVVAASSDPKQVIQELMEKGSGSSPVNYLAPSTKDPKKENNFDMPSGNTNMTVADDDDLVPALAENFE